MEERIVAKNVLLIMNKDYDKQFHQEVERILKELYYNPIDMGDSKLKRLVVKSEKRYIDYIEELQLVKRLSSVHGNGEWGIQLERKGYEVFEKYNGWYDYKTKVLDKINKIEQAKILAQRFWWLPILISVLSLVVSFFALFIKK